MYVCVCMCVSVLAVHTNVVLHIEFIVPVTITDSTYYVREGSSTSVTLRTIGAHNFNFTVFLIIADGECQSVMDSITVHSMLLSIMLRVLLQQ